MRLTTKGRFAVTAMIDLALRSGDGPVTLAGISDRQKISLSYLEQLFGKLRRFSIVDSVRGPGGGYCLARPANQITVADIVRAVEPGETYQTLPFVRPGGEILLKIEGWPKVEDVLRHVDAIERAGIDACDVAPDHWRHVAQQMQVGEAPRSYTPERHQAWLKRREIER